VHFKDLVLDQIATRLEHRAIKEFSELQSNG
jgi:hypothetical protein